jgi:hypothetical protein
MVKLEFFCWSLQVSFWLLVLLLTATIVLLISIPSLLKARLWIALKLSSIFQRILLSFGVKSTTPSQSMELDWSDLETLSESQQNPSTAQPLSSKPSTDPVKKPSKKKKETTTGGLKRS